MPIVNITNHETCHDILHGSSPHRGRASVRDARTRLSASLEALLYPVLLAAFVAMAGGFLGQTMPREDAARSICKACPAQEIGARPGKACG